MNRQQDIMTPCPSCGSKTLFIATGGHLTCSLIGCKQPVVEDAIKELRADAELWRKIDAVIREANERPAP